MADHPSRAVLFDLDGTLADTAPDLAGALNRLRLEKDLPALPLAQLRPHVSAGARGLIGAGLGIAPDHPEYPSLQERFLDIYQDALCVETRLFDGMPALLARLESIPVRWGIVTNKAKRFTEPLVRALGLGQRTSCVVSGDSAARAKPHPDPLLLASDIVGVPPAHCIYLGDDERDVQAGRAAGMRTVIAAWGYLGSGRRMEDWGADDIIHDASAMLDILEIRP